jgi:hypothetical protein
MAQNPQPRAVMVHQDEFNGRSYTDHPRYPFTFGRERPDVKRKPEPEQGDRLYQSAGSMLILIPSHILRYPPCDPFSLTDQQMRCCSGTCPALVVTQMKSESQRLSDCSGSAHDRIQVSVSSDFPFHQKFALCWSTTSRRSSF